MSDGTPETLVLEEVIAKEPDKLSDEEKTFLTDHKDDLTTSEAQKFGIPVETKVEPEVRTTPQAPKKDEGEEGEDGEEILPEDEKAINKVVSKRLTPFEKQVKEQQDIIDVNNLIASKPDYAPYRDQILTYAKHDAYKQIPIHHIAAMVSAKDQQKLGARKERQAQKDADATKGGGTTVRPGSPQPIDWHTASKEDYLKKRAEIFGSPQ